MRTRGLNDNSKNRGKINEITRRKVRANRAEKGGGEERASENEDGTRIEKKENAY